MTTFINAGRLVSVKREQRRRVDDGLRRNGVGSGQRQLRMDVAVREVAVRHWHRSAGTRHRYEHVANELLPEQQRRARTTRAHETGEREAASGKRHNDGADGGEPGQVRQEDAAALSQLEGQSQVEECRVPDRQGAKSLDQPEQGSPEQKIETLHVKLHKHAERNRKRPATAAAAATTAQETPEVADEEVPGVADGRQAQGVPGADAPVSAQQVDRDKQEPQEELRVADGSSEDEQVANRQRSDRVEVPTDAGGAEDQHQIDERARPAENVRLAYFGRNRRRNNCG